MVAAVQHKCVRLIRVSIEDMNIEGINPGEVKEVSRDYFYETLKL
jgi:23S rRNA pseudouridine2457 synthase